MKVVGFCGFSGSGKTTLVEQLISRLRLAGQRVSVIKHAHHDFDIDHPRKDSWRHRQAGAFEVVIASGLRHIEGRLRGKALGAQAFLARKVSLRALDGGFGRHQLRLRLLNRATLRCGLTADALDGRFLRRDPGARAFDGQTIVAIVDHENDIARADARVVAHHHL